MSPPRISPVRMRLRTDCGIACLASLSHRPYVDVLSQAKVLFGDKVDREGLDDGQVTRLARVLKLRVGPEVTARDWGRVSTLALAATFPRRLAGGLDWHWMIYVPRSRGAYLIDPDNRRRSPIRIDFLDVPLYSFRPVSDLELPGR